MLASLSTDNIIKFPQCALHIQFKQKQQISFIDTQDGIRQSYNHLIHSEMIRKLPCKL